MTPTSRLQAFASILAAFSTVPSALGQCGTQPIFPNPILTHCEGPIASVAVGDLDHDGRDDLVLVRGFFTGSGPELIVKRSEPDDTFVTMATYDSTENPNSLDMELADLNGDGELDLVQAMPLNAGQLVVRLGDAGAVFGAETTYPAGHAPRELVLHDLDQSGSLDVVLRNTGDDSITVMLGVGDGTFGAPVDLPLDDEPTDVAVADVTHDGIPDLVVTSEDGNAVMRLSGVGDGTFAAAETLVSGAPYVRTEMLDVNDDALLDLVVMREGMIETWLIGSDGSATAHVTHPLAGRPLASIARDVNQDGEAELLLSLHPDTTNGDTVQCWQTDAVTALTLTGEWFAGSYIGQLVSGHLNNDGALDLIARANGEVVVLRGTGDASFEGLRRTPFRVAGQDAQIVDVNGDGLEDILSLDAYSGDIRVHAFLATAPGTWNETPVQTLFPGVAYALTHGDLNQDGIVDAVVGTEDGTVEFLIGNGDGSFNRSTSPIASSDSAYRVLIAHLNDDTIPDLAVLTRAPDSLLILELDADQAVINTQVLPLAGFPFKVISLSPDSAGPQHLALGLATGLYLARPGESGYELEVGRLLPSWASDINRADMNEDGILDYVVPQLHEDGIAIMVADSDGHPGPPLAFETGAGREVATADFDGDGHQDVATSLGDTGNPGVLVMYGDGQLGFRSSSMHMAVSLGSSPEATAHDVDMDGRPDLVIRRATLQVLYNRGAPTPPSCPADLAGDDGTVDFNDLLALLAAWGTSDADLNDDGTTDFSDLVILLGQWGPCAESL